MRRLLGWRAPLLPFKEASQGTLQPRRLFTGAAVVVVSVIALMGWMLWDAHRIVRLHTLQSAENLATALEHDIERNLDVYDLSLQAVVEGLSLPGIDSLSPEMRNYVLFDKAATARHLGALMVLDETGKVRIDSRANNPPDANFAEQEFFRLHRDRDTAGLMVSGPLKDSLTGRWEIVLSRRLANRDGKFAGIVFGSWDLDFFAQLFAAIDTGADGAIALFQTDGRLVYRYPHHDELVGANLSKSSVFPRFPWAQSGSFEVVSVLDGVDRFFGYRRVGAWPLVVTVGLARDAAFTEWNRKAMAVAIAMIALLSLVTILGWALMAELRRRTRAERAALEAGSQYRLLAEHSADMIVRFDPRSQRRTYISPSCRHLYGYEPEEAIAISATEIIHPDDLDRVHQAVNQLDRGGQAAVTYRGRRKDGTYIWVEASLTPVSDPDTGATEIVSVVRDIGERVRYEAALRAAKEDADAANHAKSAFLGTMSHELRTPLNAIIGFADLMRLETMGPIGNEKYRSYVADIHSSGTHLLQLINEILDLTKAEAGKLELHEEVFDLASTIQSIARLCGPQIEEAGLKIAIDLAPDLPGLRADEHKTRQVLFNLLGNALKFTPAGGRIEVAARLDPQTGVRVTVTDTGIGIASEDLDRVFEPFVQVESELSRNYAGTGLGLSVVKAIMELHHGTVELTSNIGVGTAVTVVFPRELAITAHQSQQSRPAA